MDDRSDMEKGDEVILPGFRFHPTDEELVSFYLKRKVQQKPLSIELIRQLDIYKYDPWDLPKLATTGEKEWYFYCPRDRKYRNSTRPNRVTGAGFWKATGTDRPIYSSEGSKCIGLKKSLVFYKGRAAKGVKTDWMMHEFRLPSLTDSSLFKRPLDKTIPANDSWAICRIFKKTNSVAQRALSHSWVSPQPDPTANEPDLFSLPPPPSHNIHFGSEIISSIAESMPLACSSYNLQQQQQQQQQQNAFNFPPLDFISSFKPTDHLNINWSKPACSSAQTPKSFTFSPVVDTLIPPKCAMDVTSMLLNNLSPALLLGDVGKTSTNIDFSGQQQQQQCNEFAVDLPLESNANFRKSTEVDFPFGLPPTFTDEWKPSLACVSTPYQCGISTSTYSTDKY